MCIHHDQTFCASLGFAPGQFGSVLHLAPFAQQMIEVLDVFAMQTAEVSRCVNAVSGIMSFGGWLMDVAIAVCLEAG